MTGSANTEERIAALEERIAKLEAAAALFEEHRQSWIWINQQLAKDEEARLKRR